MSAVDMPTISACNYASLNYNWVNPDLISGASIPESDSQLKQVQNFLLRSQSSSLPIQQPKAIIMSRRIVRIYIVDRTEDVPLEQAVLYTGAEKLTDLNDQELYFEVPVKDLLDKHNLLRATILNKKATERAGKDIFLDPLKIRDLVMSVTTVAAF